MGKLVAYLGPPTAAANVIETGSSAFVRQAADYPDGFGLGWFPDDRQPNPVRLLSREPIACGQLEIPRRYPSHCIAAVVHRTRAASNPAAMPFATGPHLYCQVSEVQDFDDVFRRPLLQRLSAPAFATLAGVSPQDVMFATFADLLGDRTGHDAIAEALEQLVGILSEIRVAGVALAIVVADQAGLVVLRTATQGPPPPLYTIVTDAGAPLPATARIVASEPLFPGAWSALEPNSLTIFTGELRPEDTLTTIPGPQPGL